MTPDNAHSLEAAKSTGRARRIALKAAFSLMQIGLGAACVIGTFWGVTRFLAGDFEAAGRAPISPGASATGIASGVLAVATQVRATEMPDIKRGVPELMPLRVSTFTATDQPKLSPTVIRNFAAKPVSTTQVEVPVIGSTAAWHDESSSDRRRLHEERVAVLRASRRGARAADRPPRRATLPGSSRAWRGRGRRKRAARL